MTMKIMGSSLGFLVALVLGTAVADESLPRVYTHWESFHVSDGLPSDKVFCIAVDRDRVWAGTDRGLACYENGKWSGYTTADGMTHNAVLCIAVDAATRDVWAGTMGGLTHISAGRFKKFTQFNSGLPNDVVFGVTVENQNVWVATTSGEGRFRVREKAWDVYTPENCPQHEPWGYSIDYDDGKVWAALWGGGALEFDVATGRWKMIIRLWNATSRPMLRSPSMTFKPPIASISKVVIAESNPGSTPML